MTDKAKLDLQETVKILRQLDKRSLLLIDSGARLLKARQDMDMESVGERKLQEC